MEGDTTSPSSGELLLTGRLVPAGRDGNKIFARMLRPGEEDPGESVHLNPGEQLVIPAGGLVIDSREIDAMSPRGLGGYAPVANTVWTWYAIVGEDPEFLRFFCALARRIDAAHGSWARGVRELERARQTPGIAGRAAALSAHATAESTIIALNRGITMVDSLKARFCPSLEIPESIEKVRTALQELRNAFEHIDERSEGKVGLGGKLQPEALSAFDQPDFRRSPTLHYGSHQLNFETDIIAALVDGREMLMQAIDERASQRSSN